MRWKQTCPGCFIAALLNMSVLWLGCLNRSYIVGETQACLSLLLSLLIFLTEPVAGMGFCAPASCDQSLCLLLCYIALVLLVDWKAISPQGSCPLPTPWLLCRDWWEGPRCCCCFRSQLRSKIQAPSAHWTLAKGCCSLFWERSMEDSKVFIHKASSCRG